MALDENQIKNTMIGEAPVKKGFHFAATLEHAAEYIEAETVAEAEVIYQKIKRPVGGTVEPAAPEQPTAPADTEEAQ